MTVQRWSPEGSTMIAVPNGRFVLATDYDAMLDAQRGLTAKAEADAADARKRAAEAERYVAGQDVRSDFATAAEMRAALDDANRRLALAVAEVKAWRVRYASKCPADAGTLEHLAYYTAAAKSLAAARAATNADPVLAKMIGGVE